MEKLRVLSLFSGIGAFEKALTNIGVSFELVNFCELDKYAIRSYCAIHNVDESINLGDITKIDLDILPKGIDLLTHGSPCQDYSLAGKQAGGDKGSGTRSSLMWSSVEIIRRVKPKHVIWENVKGVLSHKNKHNFDKYVEDLNDLGYVSSWKVLNSCDFGVPQNRERVFCISTLGGGEFEFPEIPYIDCKLSDILGADIDKKYYISPDKYVGLEEKLKKHNQKISYCIDANYWKGTTPQQFISKCRRQLIVASRGRYDQDGSISQNFKINTTGLTNSITTVQKDNYLLDMRSDISLRKLTPLECWRLQSFSDDDFYKCAAIGISNTQLYKQAGNSITVKVLEYIFKELFKQYISETIVQ